MISYTAAQIKRLAPLAKPALVDALVEGIADVNGAGITTPRRLHHFLATTCVETGGLRALDENLNYSAERLHEVWPKRFPTVASAQPFAKNPKALANKVYGGRLGNVKANDGWIYRGGGYIQTTGRENYRNAGYEDNPEALRDPKDGLVAALRFWVAKGCNALADRDSAEAVRQRVNGGQNGLKEYKAYLAKARQIFTDHAPVEELPSVKAIQSYQRKLKDLGYFPGVIDGIVGSQTIGEISKFQAENGLKVTGEFDAATIEMLDHAKPRVVERANPKPEDSRIEKAADKLIKGAGTVIVGGGATVGADKVDGVKQTLDGVKEQMETVKAIVDPLAAIKDFVVGTVGVPGLVIVVAAAVLVIAWRIRSARREDHLNGKTA